MRLLPWIAALPLAAMLAGCGGFSGLSYVMANYGTADPVEFPYAEAGVSDTFRVFDRPADGRLMITPSMATAVGMGVGRGLSFGATAGTDSPVPVYRNAALAYLKSTGRSCTIATFDLVAAPQYEASYSCPPPAPVQVGKAKGKI